MLVAVKIGLSLLCCKNRQKAGVAGAQCQGETSPGRSWRGGGGEQTALASQDMERLLISWEAKKETIWRPSFRTVNLCFIRIRISLVPAWRGDWKEGQKQKEGNQEIFIVFQA